MDATPEDQLGLNTYAVEALNITVFALGAASESTPTHEAQAANNVAIDLLGQVDFLLRHDPLEEELLIQREGDEKESPGPLKSGEIEAQRTSIALLGATAWPDLRAIEGYGASRTPGRPSWPKPCRSSCRAGQRRQAGANSP